MKILRIHNYDATVATLNLFAVNHYLTSLLNEDVHRLLFQLLRKRLPVTDTLVPCTTYNITVELVEPSNTNAIPVPESSESISAITG